MKKLLLVLGLCVIQSAFASENSSNKLSIGDYVGTKTQQEIEKEITDLRDRVNQLQKNADKPSLLESIVIAAGLGIAVGVLLEPAMVVVAGPLVVGVQTAVTGATLVGFVNREHEDSEFKERALQGLESKDSIAEFRKSRNFEKNIFDAAQF